MPRRLLPYALLPLLVAPSLLGCTTAVVSLAPPAKLPPNLWQCQAQPPLPSDTASDATFFGWVGATMQAGQSCRDALATAHTAVEGGSAHAKPHWYSC